MKNALLVLAVALFSFLFIFGCTVNSPSSGSPDTGNSNVGCPAAGQGENFCGFCPADRVAADSPRADKCRYCPQAYSCPGDPCSDCVVKEPDCPPRQGQTFCGYCSEDPSAAVNGGKCVYCPQGYTCASDFCRDIKCSAGASGGGSAAQKTYYASCSQCVGISGYSYRGPSYDACYAYYVACVESGCGKILDNCR